MHPLWRHDGVLEYESPNGFAIRMVRKDNRVDVDCTRDGVTIGVGMSLDPDAPEGLNFPFEKLEAGAIGTLKGLLNLRAVKRGELQPFPVPEEPPPRKGKKKGKG